jgi:GntR family transcriptional repressor for pyruvate dehydrogenase complex
MKDDLKLLILNSIRESGVPVGAVYLSERLNIPSATVGRVLSSLENEGYIEKVSNKGRQLTDKGKSYLVDRKNWTHKINTASKLLNIVESISKERLLEILQVRQLLEDLTVELACKNATEHELQELDKIMLDYAYDLRYGGLGNEYDLQLHLKIAEISHNQTVHQILKLILTEKNAYTKFSSVADSLKNMQLIQHDEIVQAVKARDVTRAKLAMSRHINKIIADVMQYYYEEPESGDSEHV